MPGKQRPLSGSEVVRILAAFGFQPVGQKGSHIKLRRVTADGRRQTLNIPNHPELRTGTLRTIIRQASQYVPEDQLRPHFFAQ